MKTALIIGGASGIGLSIAVCLAKSSQYSSITILDRNPLPPDISTLHPTINSQILDLNSSDLSVIDQYLNVDLLMITAGFGQLNLFQDVSEQHIIQSFNVNTIAPIRIIHRFYPRLLSNREFFCGIMGSIAGFLSSPFFATYAATKAALKIFIESINIELEKAGTQNRVLNVSPGAIKGTSFYNEKTNLSLTENLAQDIIVNLYKHSDLLIPQYDTIYRQVLERYHTDFRAEGRHSYDYKLKSQRLNK